MVVAWSGDDGDRTHDLRLAKPALYQLSYVPGVSILPRVIIHFDGFEGAVSDSMQRSFSDQAPASFIDVIENCGDDRLVIRATSAT